MDSGTAAQRAPETGDRSWLSRWLPVLGVGALLGAAAVAAALSTLHVSQVPLHDQEPTAAPPTGPTPAVPSASALAGHTAQSWVRITVPSWLTTLVTYLCGAVVVVLVAVLVWYVIRDYMPVRRAAPVVEPTQPYGLAAASTREVVAAVEAGLAGLSDTDTDPRRAIIACWLRLEEAAAGAGTPREIGDTSTDLVLRLLAAHRVSRPVLAGFAAMYRQARYSSGPVDESMRAQAVGALRHVRAELAAEAAAAEAAAAAAAAEAERVRAEQARAEQAGEPAAGAAARHGGSDNWFWGER